MIVVKAFIKKSVNRNGCTIGNSCTE